MYWSSGILRYGPGIRAVVEVDDNLAKYYLALLPNYIDANPQMYRAHITVVRIGKEPVPNMEVWKKYTNEVIPFAYSPTVETDGTYYYLKVRCLRIQQIREELGLPAFRPGRDCYHLTIANCKETK